MVNSSAIVIAHRKTPSEWNFEFVVTADAIFFALPVSTICPLGSIEKCILAIKSDVDGQI
jgi:hypothetical protein